MKYDPTKSKAPPDRKPGTYHWVVTNAVEKTALGSGYDYIRLTLAVRMPEFDEPQQVYSNLLSHPNALWRTEQFCECVDIVFAAGELQPSACIGLEGDAEFDFGRPNQDGRRYLEVTHWTGGDTPTADDQPPPPTDDDIPF